MKTLELKDIAPYLAYGLKWTLQELTTFEMSGLTETTLFTTRGTVLNWRKQEDLPQALFPLMLPLSALTEPMEDGSVPIVELANIAYKWQKWDKERINKKNCVLEGSPYDFWVSEGTKDFMLCDGSGYLHINNQLALFEYLYQHHFWLGDQSLFTTGEIIDRRTVR